MVIITSNYFFISSDQRLQLVYRKTYTLVCLRRHRLLCCVQFPYSVLWPFQSTDTGYVQPEYPTDKVVTLLVLDGLFKLHSSDFYLEQRVKNMLYNILSQSVCQGTLKCHQSSSGVSRNFWKFQICVQI